MSQLAVYGTAIAFGFLAWGLGTSHYIWPELRGRSNADALLPLLLLHCFRFLGLAFVVPGIVSRICPLASQPRLRLDLIAAVLAVLALAAGLQTKLPSSGCSTRGEPATSSTPSIRAFASGSNRVKSVLPTSS